MSVTVNAKNQVTNAGFTYDSGGNVTADGTYTYAWDGENHLTSTNGVTYTYDGDGKRVKKSNGTLYWYDVGGNVIEENDASGNRVSAYIYFNGKRVGRYDPSGAHYAYLSDLLGSSVVVTDSIGHIQKSSDYYPFGGERVVTSSLTDHYKFTGMERDTESGLDHTLYRQFTSTYGRWISPDSQVGNVANPQSWSRYEYVLNNPVTLTDPLGLEGEPGPLACPWWNPTCYSGGNPRGTGGGGGPCVEVISAFHRGRPEVSCGMNQGGGSGLLQQVLQFVSSKLAPCLAKDGECMSFLSGKGAMPLATLSSLNIRIETMPPNFGATTTLQFANPASALPTSAVVNVNSAGAFFENWPAPGAPANFNQGEKQATILLHELAHATMAIPLDYSDTGKSTANTSTLIKNCTKTIECCGH